MQCLHPGLMTTVPAKYLPIALVPPPSDLGVSEAQLLPDGLVYKPKSFSAESSFLSSSSRLPTHNTALGSHLGSPRTWHSCAPEGPYHSELSHTNNFTCFLHVKFLKFDHYKTFQNKNFLTFWCICNPLCFKFFHQIFLVLSFTFKLSIPNLGDKAPRLPLLQFLHCVLHVLVLWSLAHCQSHPFHRPTVIEVFSSVLDCTPSFSLPNPLLCGVEV